MQTLKLPSTKTVSDRAYQLIRYFDCFDHPVEAQELADLLGLQDAQLQEALAGLERSARIESRDGLYFIPGKAWSVPERRAGRLRFARESRTLRRAVRIIAAFPFVRGILLTGSAAKGGLEEHDDFDFFLLVRQDRLWLCRFLLTLFRKLISRNYRRPVFKHFCCNHFLSVQTLQLPEQNEFIAFELACARPVYNPDLCRRFFQANAWAGRFYRPLAQPLLPALRRRFNPGQKLAELFFDCFWNRRWEQVLREKHFDHWRRYGTTADRRAFERRSNLNYIKNETGKRQAFLLDRLRDAKSTEFRSRLQTQVALRRAAGSHPGPDLLLAHAYFLSKTRLEKKHQKPYVPLGPLAVAAFVRQHGFTVDFYDTTFRPGPEAFARYLIEHPVSLVGLYILEVTRHNALEMIRMCRSLNTAVIAGGPDPSAHPEFYREHGAQAVVVGEGEEALLDILRQLRQPERPVSELAGVYVRPETFRPRPQTARLDDLPLTARDLVDLGRYQEVWIRRHGCFCLQITASRGCPYRCAWCAKPVFGSTLRTHSPQRVVDEMLAVQQRYHPSRLWFTDDVLGLRPGWLEEFQAEVRNRRVRMPFECLARVDRVDPDFLRRLKDCGCQFIWYGAESGSQRILDKMDKQFTVAQIRQAAALTRAAGIRFGFFIMLGYLSETLADIELTRRLLRDTQPDACGLALAYPLKGTRFYEEVRARSLLLAPRDRYESDRRPGYRTAYSHRFYALVQRLLGKEVQLARQSRPSRVERLKRLAYRQAYEGMRRWEQFRTRFRSGTRQP